MTFPESPTPQPPPRAERTRPSRAQRRRAQRRRAMPASVEGRSALLRDLVERAYPSYEFFVFAILCGALLGVGYIFDAQAFLIFGILMSPLLTPWVGMALAGITGSLEFLFKTFSAFSVGALFIFLSSVLAGLASRIWLPLTFNQAFSHARLWWPDLIALALGATLLTASFVRSEKKPFLPSVMVAYELFMPLSAGAFGLGNGVGDLWPQGLLVFVIHLAWSLLFGALTLFLLGFRPMNAGGFIVSGGILAAAVVVFFALSGLGTSILQFSGVIPTSTPVPTEVVQADAPSVAAIPSLEVAVPASSTPPVTAATATPSRTPTPGITLSPTGTATPTLTPEPTPLYARISASRGGGAYVRREPGGPVILTVANGDLVEVLSEPIAGEGGPWVHVLVVRDTQRIEGWIIQAVLQTATPAPGW